MHFAVAAALLQGCAPKAGIFPVGGIEIRHRSLSDDLGFRQMREAVAGSISYYRGLPETAVFRYGDLLYSPREMEESMLLFLRIVETLKEHERTAAIRERFHFFDSRNDRGKAFFTGYYEPVIPGSPEPTDEFQVPLYGVPEDLVRIDLGPYMELGLLPQDLENRILRGKVRGGTVVPFDDRESIVYGGSLRDRAEVLAYVSDHIELSFLQIQGSGLLRMPDGSLVRLNYAAQNGHPYRAVGRLLLDRIPREEMSLQSIRSHLYGHPEEVRGILNYNPSYTFFRVTEEGPLGLIEVPLTPGRSIAMDSRLLPRGGLVYFETTYPAGSMADQEVPFGRFGVVQDTGGAIRGHGRADIFWGSGEAAERIAGRMKQDGRIMLLVARKEFLGAVPPPAGKAVRSRPQ